MSAQWDGNGVPTVVPYHPKENFVSQVQAAGYQMLIIVMLIVLAAIVAKLYFNF